MSKKDEALKLALEALELCNGAETAEGVVVYTDKEITALRQALANEALDKKAENAKELGLDYEPSSVSKLAREAGIRNCTCNGTKGCLERFHTLARNAALDEIAAKIALMPFGDTAASFAVWIREQRT